MSCVVVLAPVVIAAWPVLVSSIVAAAAAAGFKVVKDVKEKASSQSVELDMENAQVVAESLAHDDRIVVERQGVRVTFSRDARGRFTTCVEGDLSKDQLKTIGEDLSGRVIQQYVYRRMSEELGANGFVTMEEAKDRTSRSASRSETHGVIMEQHDLEITIGKDGKVQVRVAGAKGKQCLQYAQFWSRSSGSSNVRT